MKIAVILGSIREGRLSPGVGNRVLEEGKQYPDIEFNLIDLKEYNLPVMSKRFSEYEGNESEYPRLKALKKELEEADGYIFIAQEYNHAITAALKNIFDYFSTIHRNKSAGIVSYGNNGGAVAAEQLKQIFGIIGVAGVSTNVTASLQNEFTESGEFNPSEFHIKRMHSLIQDVKNWGEALKPLREEKQDE